ncbi:hypothetical protein [Microlunatus speluncae]|uniref:hypothetical protein n=1 Tax=Microlunatus speluncae TaxID=2594267 RepID=UPI0012666D79|nr:hypothetical protein [Microlunatus speluncae]
MPAQDRSAAERLRRAVAYAVTGADPALTATSFDGEAFDPAALIAELGGVATLRSAAAEARAAGLSWPYPVPERLRQGLGAAQVHAAVRRVSSLIDEPPRPVIRRPATPDADDLRLLRDVPPHHGG